MALTKYKLGDLIEQNININTDLLYSKNDVKGMTITKEVIPTKAYVAETDLSKFLVVNPYEFIYNPRTHGKKIGFGYNNTNRPFIISWNNISFRVKPQMLKVVLSDYLFLHFKRDEWDREACFQSWGSSTEVFSWDALCNMSLELPDIKIQQKYVDIYNAMVKNQQCYERGLDDLKISYEGLINVYKHKSSKKNVGDILVEVDCCNVDNTIKNVQGINIQKQFMPTVADMEDVNLSKYKLVKKGQFAFSGMQTGRDKCIRIALFQEEEPIIISPAYTVLEVQDENILPEYVMMWFSRKETDRLGWFYSDASIRTNLDMERFCEIKIPIPDIKIQQSIVNIYDAYNKRKEINENLKQQIKNICPILIKGSIEEAKEAEHVHAAV